jgi:PadR family transcriptional regulator PadR
MPAEVRITTTVAKVLRAFLEDTSQPRYGFELMKATGLPSGSLYPILARLEAAGWLASSRENVDPAAEGRPARRMYQISPRGAQAAHAELAELSSQLRPPVRVPGRVLPQGGLVD